MEEKRTEEKKPRFMFLDLSACVQIEMLTMEERGQLFTAILDYANFGETSVEMSRVLSIVFQRFKQDIDDDFAKYRDKCHKMSENAKKKAEQKKQQQAEASNCNQQQAEASNLCKSAYKDKDKDKDKSILYIDIGGVGENDEPDKSVSPPPPKKKEPERHKYGEYSNVLLSDAEYQKLQEEFPTDYGERIERLSGYIASTGKKYKSHLATIRNWAKKDAEQPYRNTGQSQEDGWDYIYAVAEGRA